MAGFVTEAHPIHDLNSVLMLFHQHSKKICAFCHGYGHSEGRCTTRRAMWREANALSLRGAMGLLCGRLKTENCEEGGLRKRNYQETLFQQREQVRVGSKKIKPSTQIIVEQVPVPPPQIQRNQQTPQGHQNRQNGNGQNGHHADYNMGGTNGQ